MTSIQQKTAAVETDNQRLIAQNTEFARMRDAFAGKPATLLALTLLERDAQARLHEHEEMLGAAA